jgi:hypothetical protein
MGKDVTGTERQRIDDILENMIIAGIFRPGIKTLRDIDEAMWDSIHPTEESDANDTVIKHGTVDALSTFHKNGVLTGLRYWVGMTEVSFGSNTLTRDAEIRTYPVIKE